MFHCGRIVVNAITGSDGGEARSPPLVEPSVWSPALGSSSRSYLAHTQLTFRTPRRSKPHSVHEPRPGRSPLIPGSTRCSRTAATTTRSHTRRQRPEPGSPASNRSTSGRLAGFVSVDREFRQSTGSAGSSTARLRNPQRGNQDEQRV